MDPSRRAIACGMLGRWSFSHECRSCLVTFMRFRWPGLPPFRCMPSLCAPVRGCKSLGMHMAGPDSFGALHGVGVILRASAGVDSLPGAGSISGGNPGRRSFKCECRCCPVASMRFRSAGLLRFQRMLSLCAPMRGRKSLGCVHGWPCFIRCPAWRGCNPACPCWCR